MPKKCVVMSIQRASGATCARAAVAGPRCVDIARAIMTIANQNGRCSWFRTPWGARATVTTHRALMPAGSIHASTTFPRDVAYAVPWRTPVLPPFRRAASGQGAGRPFRG